jgi:MFS family permease
MTDLLRPMTALFIGAAVLLTGQGLQNLLVVVRADAEDFSDLSIGLVGASYFVGFIAGCFYVPRLIGRVGHVRAFTAFTALATVAPLALALFPVPPAWWALRILTGLCFAGLTMVIESWLNGATGNERRGRIMSLYTILNFGVVTLGQLLINLASPSGFELFALVAILISLAAVPVALGRSVAPAPPRTTRLRFGVLLRNSPVALVACLANGLANAAFWSLAPVFGARTGLDLVQISLFMSFAMIGGAIAQWPLGLWSDSTDRRRVILAAAILASLSAFGLAAVPPGSVVAQLVLSMAFGATSFPIYALAVAHANDVARKGQSVSVSSGLLLTYGIGAIAGPLLAAGVMSLAGAAQLFAYTGIVHFSLAAFILLRLSQKTRAPKADRQDFVPLSVRTSPAVYDLDPRGEDDAARR